MTLAGDVLFNLMLNALPSFWLGLALALLIWRFARPSRVSVGVIVLLLPMAKLLWDLGIGIPSSSFFWASEQGIRQRLGSFQIGFGAHPWGASVQGQLWAEHAAGRSPQSIADLLSRALRFRVSIYAASVVSFTFLCVSMFKCIARARGLIAFRRQLRALLLGCTRTEWRAVGRRRVRVCTSEAYAGVPFAGGLISPYVVLPAGLAERLGSDERNAVIEHELGHIRYFDLALLVPLEFLCDLFWFVPGMKGLLAKLRGLLEQRADDCAVAAGIARESVASALLVAAELVTSERPAPVLGMSRSSSTLAVRLRHLLTPEPTPTVKPWFGVVRGLVLLWLVLGTLQASACGNQP